LFTVKKERLRIYQVFLDLVSPTSLRAVLCIGQIIYVHVCNWNTKYELLNTESKLPLFLSLQDMFVGDTLAVV